LITHPALFRRLTAFLVLALTPAVVVGAEPSQPAGRIATITPQSGRPGDEVTIAGIGFGALNLRVTVAGVPALLIRATGSTATFVVPGRTPAGVVSVVATNPGGEAGAIQFRVLEGVLLPGNPAAPVADALTDVRPIPGSPADVDVDGFILTRLDVRLTPDATVGELNVALVGVNGGIVGMQRGVLTVVVGVPRQPTAADLRRQAASMAAFPGIRLASAGRQSAAKVLPFNALDPEPNVPSLTKLDVMGQLVPSRFPAAWNAAGADQRLLDGCRPVPVIVQDYLGQASPDWTAEFPTLGAASLLGDGSAIRHGFDVLMTLAANFDAHALTGANPFQQCLDLRPLKVLGLSKSGEGIELAAALQSLSAGKAVVNHSFGYGDLCLPCAPADIPALEATGLERAYETLEWKEATSAHWNDFAIAVAAGNERDKPLSAIYAAFGLATYGSPVSIATTFDPFLTFAGQASLFAPPATRPDFPTLAATTDELITLASDAHARGLDLVPAAFNTLIVGSTTRGRDAATLAESAFSDAGADVLAVGECVVMSLDPGRCSNGTSFAAPQVAGLLSYLWLLSPELRDNRSSSDAVRAIQDNVRTTSANLPFLDAYAAVLSLDAAGALTPATAPIRLALLDLDGNGSFSDDDLEMFVIHYFDDALELPVEPTARDYSQFDLNGDGFTGGTGVDRFDLDRSGSTQFGRSIYSAVEYDLGGVRVNLNENGVTDLQILCYYAYSPLYTGLEERRETMLADFCGITVTVNPPSVTLAPGGTQQFAATVRGTTDPRVTWVLPNGGGTISATGFFTAGTTPGSYIVRAISVVDPDSFADAAIAVGGATGSMLQGSLTLHSHTNYGPGLSVDTLISVTLTAQPKPVEVDETPLFVVTAVTGTGTYTAEATSNCNRPPEIRSGTAVSGTLTISQDLLVATLKVQFAGTSTHTSCNNPTTVTNFEGTLSDGTFIGTPVVVSGEIVAIDFDRSETITTFPPPRVLVQTGRLVR